MPETDISYDVNALSGQTAVIPRTRALSTSASGLQPFQPLAPAPNATPTSPPPEVQAAIAQSHADAQAAKGGDASGGAAPTGGAAKLGAAQSGADAIDKGIDRATQEEKARIEEMRTRRQQEYAMIPDVPKPIPFNPPQQTSPVQAWGSMAMMVAALGGLMTRGHATTALKAAGGVLDAFHKGDVEASQQYFDQWKIANENMAQTFKFQMDRLNADMHIADSDEALGTAMYNADMKAFGMHQDEARNKIDMQKSLIDMATAQTQLDQIANRMPFEYAMNRAGLEIMKSPEYINGTPQQKIDLLQPVLTALNSKAGSAATTGGLLSDDDAKMLAEMRMAGDPTALQGLGYGGTGAANRAKVEHFISEGMKQQHLSGADLAQRDAEFFGLKATERVIGTRSAQADLAVTEAQRMIPLMLQAARAVPREKFVPFNKAFQLWQANMSDPKLTAFVTAINSFIPIYARSTSPTNTPTQANQEHARDILSTATSEEAFEASMNILDSEMSIAKNAPAEVLNEVRNEHRASMGLQSIDDWGEKTGGTGGAAPPNGPGVYTDAQGRKATWDGTKWVTQ